jgi:hypothetical protein
MALPILFNSGSNPSVHVIRQLQAGDAALASGIIISGLIASGQVGFGHLADGSVKSGTIASGQVGWPHLASGAVRSGHIADNAVNSGNISSGQVGWPHLASGAVRSGHIADNAVNSGNISSGQVGWPHLASGAVTSGSIASGSLMPGGLSGQLQFHDGTTFAGASGLGYTGSGTITVGVNPGGRMEIGQWPSNPSTNAFVGHSSLDQTAAGNYAILQSFGGATFLNTGSGQVLSLRQNNVNMAVMQSGSIALSGLVTADNVHISSGLIAGMATVSGFMAVGAAINTNNKVLVGHAFIDPAATVAQITISATGNSLTSDNANVFIGQNINIRLNQGGNNATASVGLRGINNSTVVIGQSGTVTGAAATYSALFNGGSGTVTTAYGNVSLVQNTGDGDIGTAYGMFVDSTANTGIGSITTNVGMRINTQTAGDNNTHFMIGTGTTGNWGIYNSNVHFNYLNGPTAIGASASPTSGQVLVVRKDYVDPTVNAIQINATPTCTLSSADSAIIFSAFNTNIAVNQGGRNLTNGIGIRGANFIPAATGNSGIITGMAGVVVGGANTGSGGVTNAYGAFVANYVNSAGGVISGLAGVAIAEQTVGVNNIGLLLGTTTIVSGSYGIYNLSVNPNYFRNNLGIGAQPVSGGANSLIMQSGLVAGGAFLSGSLIVVNNITAQSGDISAGDTITAINDITTRSGGFVVGNSIDIRQASASGFLAVSGAAWDGLALIWRTDGGGLFPNNNAGSIIYRTRNVDVAGRSSHFFYTGSGAGGDTQLRMEIDEVGDVTISGVVRAQILSGTVRSGGITGQAGGGFFNIASGTIGTFDIGSGAIISGRIASGQVGFRHLANGAVQSGSIASGQVGKPHIASGAVASGQLATTGTPDGTKFLRDDFAWVAPSFSITSGQIVSGLIGDDAVNSGNIASGVISRFHMASGAINSGHMGSGSVVGAIGAGRTIASGTIAHFDFGSGAIRSGDIASGQVGFGHLANGSVQSGTISSGEISQFHMASGAINSGHMGSGSVVGAIGAGRTIASGTIGPFDFGSGAVRSGAIASGSIGNNHIANEAVRSGHIQQGAIVTNHFAPGLQCMAPFAAYLYMGGFITNEAISGGRAVYIASGGSAGIAMASDTARMPAVGVALSGALSGTQIDVLFTCSYFWGGAPPGDIDYSGYIGQPVYVGRSGRIVTASGNQPLLSGDIIQPIGYIVSDLSGGLGTATINVDHPYPEGLTTYITSGEVLSGAIIGAAGGGFRNIASGTIGSFDIGSGAIISGRIASGQVGFGHLADDSVRASTLASGAVNSGHVASGAVIGAIGAGRSIASGTVGHFDFGSGAILSGDIASGQIGFGHLANGSVQSGTISSGEISQFHMASGAINSGHVGSGSVVGFIGAGRSIASGTVAHFDFGSGAILSGDIASGQIGFGHLANGSVQSGTISSGEISRFHMASGAINSGHVASGSVVGFVGAGRSIASGTVAHFDFGSGAILSGDIASGQIGINHLASGITIDTDLQIAFERSWMHL